MDPLLVWSSEPQRELGGLSWPQPAALQGDFHHIGGLDEGVSRHQGLWQCRCSEGLVGGAAFRAGAGGRTGWGLAPEREEVRMCRRNSKATQGNGTDIIEFHIRLPNLATK